MVVHVAKICESAVGHDSVIVSTPDEAIAEACKDWNVETVTSTNVCRSGTERLVEFAKAQNYDRYINVQADEPLLTPAVLLEFIERSSNESVSCIGASVIQSHGDILNQNVVKLAVSNSRLIYASRLPIPFNPKAGTYQFLKHTGLYSFTRRDLEVFGRQDKSDLEAIEEIEILRLLEAGSHVAVTNIENYGISVDTPSDYAEVCRILEANSQ